jgi:probable HAF family extracellular repeat protein
MSDLGVLPGGLESKAYCINGKGQVAGVCQGRSGPRAFLWDPVEGMKDLGALPGCSGSRAFCITEAGQVVGVSLSPSGNRAFLWDPVHGMTDVNALVEEGCPYAGHRFIDARAARTGERGETILVARHLNGACMFENSVSMTRLGN